MIKAVILVSRGFQDQEFCYMFDRCLEEKWHVDVATPSVWRRDGEVHSGRPDQIFGSFGVPARITKTTNELRIEDYDAVLIPGGFISPDILRMDRDTLNFVYRMHRFKKLVAAICHGPWVLVSASIFELTPDGRPSNLKATSYQSLKDDMQNAGANWFDQGVVIDDNLITAQHYKNNGEFMRAVVNWCSGAQITQKYIHNQFTCTGTSTAN